MIRLFDAFLFMLLWQSSHLELVAGQNTSQWGGCVNPSGSGSSEVTIGETTFVCLQIGNSEQWNAGVNYIRLSFSPIADEYSRFHIPNSFNDLIGQSSGTIWSGNNLTVGAASYDGLSFLRTYYQPETARVYPYLTAIINVDKGVVTGITWDNACVFCTKDKCDEITFDFNGIQQTQETSGQPTAGCYIEEGECRRKIAEEQSTECDLTLYVAWTGTDSRGAAFQSSAYRFSAFPAQELQARISQNIPEWADLNKYIN